jgi:NADH-quinone oxidoreductase subunit M
MGLFENSTGSFQFVTSLFRLPVLNINISLGIDGISLFLILLTTLLIPLCLLASWNSVSFNLKEFLIAFLILDFLLVGSFCVLDLLVFYIFFESTLIHRCF